jgi:hypothetical protein
LQKALFFEVEKLKKNHKNPYPNVPTGRIFLCELSTAIFTKRTEIHIHKNDKKATENDTHKKKLSKQLNWVRRGRSRIEEKKQFFRESFTGNRIRIKWATESEFEHK